jgi:hypothetical protein
LYKIEILDFSGNTLLTPKGIFNLLKSFYQNSMIKELYLKDLNLGDFHAKKICELMQQELSFRVLEKFDLSGNSSIGP